MKKLMLLVLICAMCLASCGKSDGTVSGTLPYSTDMIIVGGNASDTVPEAATETAEPEAEALPTTVGFYDELKGAGIYTRLESISAAWTPGRSIAILDLIPSGEAELTAATYKEVWNSAAGLHGTPPKPYIMISYTLTDGQEKSFAVTDWQGAEAVSAEGHFKLYLYDDICQPDGANYNHLNAATTNADTVISSVVISAGNSVEAVASATVYACLEGSESAAVELTKE